MASITDGGMNVIQVKTVIRAIETYQKHGIIFSRNGKPSHLRALATSYTGKPYARSAKGLQMAHDDLVALCNANGINPELGKA